MSEWLTLRSDDGTISKQLTEPREFWILIARECVRALLNELSNNQANQVKDSPSFSAIGFVRATATVALSLQRAARANRRLS